MTKSFQPGELFVYVNGDLDTGRFEIGKVKSKVEGRDEYFCYYHEGETAACTPVEFMHKLENAYCVKATTFGGILDGLFDTAFDDRTMFGVPVPEARRVLTMYKHGRSMEGIENENGKR